MKKYFLIYKTTNQINQKFYIGKHETYKLDDGYLGSGVVLTSAIQKYGTNNFSKEILYVFDNKDQMESKEKELITEEILSNPMCYNIALGGQGGNLGSEVNKKIGQTMSKVLAGVKKSASHKEAISIAKKAYKPTSNTIEKIKQTAILNYQNMSADEKRKKYGHSGHTNGSAKPVTLNGITYSTRKECCEALSITKHKLYKLLGEA